MRSKFKIRISGRFARTPTRSLTDQRRCTLLSWHSTPTYKRHPSVSHKGNHDPPRTIHHVHTSSSSSQPCSPHVSSPEFVIGDNICCTAISISSRAWHQRASSRPSAKFRPWPPHHRRAGIVAVKHLDVDSMALILLAGNSI